MGFIICTENLNPTGMDLGDQHKDEIYYHLKKMDWSKLKIGGSTDINHPTLGRLNFEPQPYMIHHLVGMLSKIWGSYGMISIS